MWATKQNYTSGISHHGMIIKNTVRGVQERYQSNFGTQTQLSSWWKTKTFVRNSCTPFRPIALLIVESVNSSSQQNTIYGLIILREAGKQLALIDETFSSQKNFEKFRCAV